jgi:hypothetical protein
MSDEMKSNETVMTDSVHDVVMYPLPGDESSSWPLPPPFEVERPHIMVKCERRDFLLEHQFLHKCEDETLEECAMRAYVFITDLMKRQDTLLEAITLAVNYNMLATVDFALTHLVPDASFLDVPNQRSPLYVAINTLNVPAVMLLLKKGVSTNIPSFLYDRQFAEMRNDWSPLMFACHVFGARNEVAFALIRHGSDINHQSENSRPHTRSALAIAAFQQNWTLVAYFLENCEEHVKEGVLEIYRQYTLIPFLMVERRHPILVDWNAFRYKKIVWRIQLLIDNMYEDDAMKHTVSQQIIDFLGYGKQEFVNVFVE